MSGTNDEAKKRRARQLSDEQLKKVADGAETADGPVKRSPLVEKPRPRNSGESDILGTWWGGGSGGGDSIKGKDKLKP